MAIDLHPKNKVTSKLYTHSHIALSGKKLNTNLFKSKNNSHHCPISPLYRVLSRLETWFQSRCLPPRPSLPSPYVQLENHNNNNNNNNNNNIILPLILLSCLIWHTFQYTNTILNISNFT